MLTVLSPVLATATSRLVPGEVASGERGGRIRRRADGVELGASKCAVPVADQHRNFIQIEAADDQIHGTAAQRCQGGTSAGPKPDEITIVAAWKVPSPLPSCTLTESVM